MCEDNEDAFVFFDLGNGINERCRDVDVIHVEVSTKDTPKETFQAWNALATEGACDESV